MDLAKLGFVPSRLSNTPPSGNISMSFLKGIRFTDLRKKQRTYNRK